MKTRNFFILLMILTIMGTIEPQYAFAGLESSLVGIKSKLTGIILPLLSVIGIASAGISFFTGNPQAKVHIFYAVVGCIIGFASQAIVDFISQIVR